ncbi:hypothetical protein ACTQ33_15975 [Candidatus Avoscillospira sp. LCP25S3_F1]|uniref:hypothetical protein n=1 Tax=Candidatus Avoscillospira sp. LCP25S3_F1 TaxID=3438825 RepID=UPI003F93A864
MKLLKRILLIIAGIALMGFFYFEPIAACIAVILLTVQLIDYRNVILRPNPFDRKIEASEKNSRYSLHQYLCEITLQNHATIDDLFIAFSEHLFKKSDLYVPVTISISSNGDTEVHSDSAFFPFQVENSYLSFKNLIPCPAYADYFNCGSVACREVEIPMQTKYLNLEHTCLAKSISITGDSFPKLQSSYSFICVPQDFTVKVPRELNEAALSSTSWSSIRFIGPNKENIDPFRDIRSINYDIY